MKLKDINNDIDVNCEFRILTTLRETMPRLGKHFNQRVDTKLDGINDRACGCI